MTQASATPRPDFESALRRLADPGVKPDVRLVRLLSAPTAADRGLFQSQWRSIDVARRRWIARALLETAESSFEVDYEALCAEILADEDAEVRILAVDALWESETPALAERFVDLTLRDTDARVRAHAATALGSFVLLGELGKLDASLLARMVRVLVDVAVDESEDVDVRRRATESVGYAQDPDADAVIAAALESDELALRAGAVRAIGRSASVEWAPDVIDALESDEAELRFEAARAAGELGIDEAVPTLLELAETDDREIQLEAVWALGEIGGRHAVRALDLLVGRMGEDDDEIREAIDEALAMAALGEGELR